MTLISALPNEHVETAQWPNRPKHRNRALAMLQLAIALTLVAWVAAESFADIWSLASMDSENSQVLLAPVVIAWLFWSRRDRLRECSPGRKWPGVLLLGVGWLLWSRGYHYQIQTFWHLGAVLLAAGCVISILGFDALAKFLPAWAALIFLIPIPGRVHLYVAVPLEHVTAALTQSVGELIGMSIGRSGNQLSVNGTDVCIAEACNGLRMVFSLFMACYVFAFIRPLRSWVRALILIASPIVAILCNVIRLVPTVWVFGHASASTAERFHDIAGWAMLGVAFLILTWTTSVIEWLGLSVNSGRGGWEIPRAALSTSPQIAQRV